MAFPPRDSMASFALLRSESSSVPDYDAQPGQQVSLNRTGGVGGRRSVTSFPSSPQRRPGIDGLLVPGDRRTSRERTRRWAPPRRRWTSSPHRRRRRNGTVVIGQGLRAVGPTCRIDRATMTRHRSTSLAAASVVNNVSPCLFSAPDFVVCASVRRDPPPSARTAPSRPAARRNG